MSGDAIGGRYRVDRVVGRGASGFVVAARHVQSRAPVALKVLTSGAAPRDLDAVARLRSPHIAPVVDAGFTMDGLAFVASELLEGQSLAELRAAEGRLSMARAVSLVQQACAGLSVAHAAGVVHGDLKPSNLFLGRDGVVRILDFGMSALVPDEDASAAWLASPAYLAPEQLREATFGPPADVWALGIMLHELVAGAMPFEAETIARLFVAIAYDEPEPLTAPDVSLELARLVWACLAKEPGNRPTANELAAGLRAWGPAESVPPSFSMTVDASSDASRTSSDAPPTPEPTRPPDATRPTRMKAAVERSHRGPPPLPGSRLGARPRAPRLRRPAPHVWPAARSAPTSEERAFRRRRLGAIACVAAAAILGVVSVLASPIAAASSRTAELDELREMRELDELRALDREVRRRSPLTFGLVPFIPPSFRSQEKTGPEPRRDRGPNLPAAIVTALPAPGSMPSRSRLYVREDPYHRRPLPPRSAPGFTHPRRLLERSPCTTGESTCSSAGR